MRIPSDGAFCELAFRLPKAGFELGSASEAVNAWIMERRYLQSHTP
jgi:hypothetical protein